MPNLKLVNADTDSIMVCKPDGSPFDKEEQNNLLKELNSLFPDMISWEDDGDFRKVVVLRAKNYILLDQQGKIKYKGSAIKATQKEPALKEMIKKIIDSILNDRNDFIEIYQTYIKEAAKIQDIKRWATRKTISDKTLNSERTNESKIRDALVDSEYVEGDRCYMYYKDKDTLELAERFDGKYDLDRLLGKCYDTAWTFESVLDCEMLFPNLKLKKNKKLLEQILK